MLLAARSAETRRALLYSSEQVGSTMPVPTVEIIDPTALPKPGYDAQYERGLVSDYYEVRRGYHVMRRQGTLTSYLM